MKASSAPKGSSRISTSGWCTSARQSEAHFADQRRSTILERGAAPKDITAALGYLLDAGSVTGQLICVDGGQHLAWRTPDVLGVE